MQADEALNLRHRQGTLADLNEVHALESASYPEDEAATREKLEYRLTHAAPYFRVTTMAREDHDGQDGIVGFLCGTLVPGEKLTHESMSRHDPNGSTLCIHSVVVSEKWRRRKLGTRLMKEYLHHMDTHQPNVKLVLLICKDKLRSFYASCGFEEVGASEVVHGKEQWYEMRYVPHSSA